MIALDRPLDLDDPDADAFLAGLQGNIVKGHGRDYAAHLVLRMVGAAAQVRAWLAGFADTQVTTAAAARVQARGWGPGDPGAPFAMVVLAPDGYRYLGFTDDLIPAPDDPFNPPFGVQYFRQGMKGQAGLPRHYTDPAVEEWEEPYQGVIHAMVILADDDHDRLEASVAAFTTSTTGVLDVLTVEWGAKLTQQFGHGSGVIEHFGYRDGISQPLMVAQDVAAEVAARGSMHWDPSAPLSMALLREPGPDGGLGSFMVFRKLEQNVAAFTAAVLEHATATGISPDDLGAMAVGRHRDGTPVVPTKTTDPDADANDFAFDMDPDGAQCPFHAHIRKTNPRGDVPRIIGAPEAFERARRIVRRGITYGRRPDLSEGGQAPTGGVGLLFMCFQANLDQFAIQQEGADGNDFIKANVGVDPLIGHTTDPVEQSWPSTGTVRFTLDDVVTMRGGEYFFAPSMVFLRGLAGGGA